MTELAPGATLVATRTFTTAMVQAWTALSADAGRHHVEPDASGRLLVHGLLVASLATELGGRLDYLARTLDFEFLRPVYTGDTITCTLRIDEVTRDDKGVRLRIGGDATNHDGVVVMRVASTGRIRSSAKLGDPKVAPP